MKGKHENQKKGFGTMNLILIVIAVALLAFTLKMIAVFEATGMIPDTIVTCVFAALGGECGAMAWIKTTKERRQDREWQKQDEAEARRREALERQRQKEENDESQR